jgi:hypothetical protein
MAKSARGRLVASASVLLVAAVSPSQAREPLGPGPAWRWPVQPSGRNEVFATGDGCAQCHSAADRAMAMRSATGDDVSPHALWQASVMANSFRDPYWRATVAKEIALQPERAAEIQALCVRCHAPMAHHTAAFGGVAAAPVAHLAGDPLATDGVSCTVCHQIRPDGLGTEASWNGGARLRKGRSIFGPYADPSGGPMRQHSGYTPVHGAHVQSSAMCATCHTLHTGAAGAPFPEQTPYLEWRNSEFTTEPGPTPTSRSCQDCHMPELAPTRIARTPEGGEFLIATRSPYRAHTFVGGNAFLLDLLAANREALGVQAPAAALARMAFATRKLLTEHTVAVHIGEIERAAGELRFVVRVDNLTGHKFPTGYPARRAWLHLQVRAGDLVVFDSGGWAKDGRLLDVAEPLQHGHVTRITTPADVLVWELIANDADGAPTTSLPGMVQRAKDNRLLPRGYRRDGPHAADTAPVGVGNDIDFTGGGDTVDVAIPLAADADPVSVVAWVRYQPIPPHWVDALRTVDAPECRSFVAMYDAADKTPETVSIALRSEARR